MDRYTLKAEIRNEVGKGSGRRLRSVGRVPAVLYGHKQEPIKLSVNTREFREAHAVGGNNAVIALQIAGTGETYDTLVKAVETDHLRRHPLHVDFQVVYMDEKIKTSVPLHLTGTAPGVKDGGVLQHLLWELEIETLPADMMEVIEVDVSALAIGDTIFVGDLQIPETARVLTDTAVPVVSVTASKAAEAVEEVLDAEQAAAGSAETSA